MDIPIRIGKGYAEGARWVVAEITVIDDVTGTPLIASYRDRVWPRRNRANRRIEPISLAAGTTPTFERGIPRCRSNRRVAT
jgi:hypothetical protein